MLFQIHKINTNTLFFQTQANKRKVIIVNIYLSKKIINFT
jgi:hypothetical protein